MARGSYDTMMLVAVLAFFCSVAVGAGLAVILFMRSGGDPYKGLPTTPPIVSPSAQPAVNDMFRLESNCWHANRWVRVTMVRLLVELDAAYAGIDPTWSAVKQQQQRQVFTEMFKRQTMDSVAELKSCAEGAWFSLPGKERQPISELIKNYDAFLVTRPA